MSERARGRVNAGIGVALVLAGLAFPARSEEAAVADSGELELVVALFRHGVRAPLKGFADTAKDHSKEDWPGLSDWGAADWGDLTEHGKLLATALGRYHAGAYKDAWPGGFNVFLWADVDPRTRDTAAALERGFRAAGIPDVTVASSEAKVDPLFHPFKAGCGEPDAGRLERIADRIRSHWQSWASRYQTGFHQLGDVLACRTSADCKLPLNKVIDTASSCAKPGDCEAPIAWKGRFSYGSSASEAFLLEYANGMARDRVGWGRVQAPAGRDRPWNLRTMFALHEFFFDKTERDRYIATIQASNLLREILGALSRKARRPVEGCPHGEEKSRFIGLVGHDTNLAGVGALLKLGWQYRDQSLPSHRRFPADTIHLPDNDALPAGALVFELRRHARGYFVRVSYVTLGVAQMRDGAGEPFRLNVNGPACRGRSRHCEMSLEAFQSLVDEGLGDRKFLSRCDRDGRQVCLATE